MASRRSRIKGIANIPQRRKNVEEVSVKLEEVENEKKNTDEIPNSLCIQTPGVSESGSIIETNTVSIFVPGSENLREKERSTEQCFTFGVKEECFNSETSTNKIVGNENKEIDVNYKTNLAELPSLPTINPSENKSSNETSYIKDHIAIGNKPNLSLRRKFKPIVNIVEKKKKTIENLQISQPTSPFLQEINDTTQMLKNTNGKNEIQNLNTSDNEVVNSNINSEQVRGEHINVLTVNINNETEITLNEINLPFEAPDPIVKPILETSPRVQNSCSLPQTDSEYPPPPPSPSISNRVRIKAIPKLNYRKTSFSASESEDETRRSKRNRNDSICSTTSVNTETVMENTSTQKSREISTIIQKKCNRTEQTRKLAEARREFQRRFGTNTPDRQKLTMMDLIFYNPDTNPMQKSESKTEEIINKTMENALVENAHTNDVEDAEKSDDENDVPVPQIKIGPSGEIILDEKSIVVERKDIKKQREEIAKSALVNGDCDTGYGIYKKHKRSKFWSTDETLRFYKALNTLGTDFTLMCDLFPGRTRRELKMKFNKEEKINRTLIDKALMKPCGFDFYVLKEEVELEQREKAELEKLRLEQSKRKEERKGREIQRRKKRIMETDVKAFIEHKITEPKPPKKPSINRKIKRKRLDINTILDDTEDADESDLDTNSEDEIISSHKPTRSGRMPKVPRKFDVRDEMVVEKVVKKSKDEIEPGSIMIVTEEGPTGEPIYKVFMITQDLEKADVELTSEEETKAIQLKKGVTAKNILTISATQTDDEEMEEVALPPLENNMTIPADDTITTLKSNPCSTLEETEEEANVQYSEPMENVENVESTNHTASIKNVILNMRRNSGFSESSYEESIPEEKNFTISEDETVTSLRPTECWKSRHDLNEHSPIKMENEENSVPISFIREISNQESSENLIEQVVLNVFPKDAEEIQID